MKTIADTNVLIALLNSDDEHNSRAVKLLGRANKRGGVYINPVIYSELAAWMESREKLQKFIEDTGIRFENIAEETALNASRKFSEYLENRDETIQCPKCGGEYRLKCGECGTELTPRQHIAADFLIGAHAEKQADQLLSFDRGFYSSYFKQLKVKNTLE